MRKTITMLSFVSLAAVGCTNVTNEPTAPGAADTPSATAESGVVHRTIVQLHSDGKAETREETLPIAQAERERAAWDGRANGTVTTNATVDGSCMGSSMWLFDHTGATSGGTYPNNNEICFFADANGCADLRSYNRYCTVLPKPGGGVTYRCYPWASGYTSDVQSFYSGADAGYFTGSDGFNYGRAPFGAYERVADTSAAATAGDPWYFTRYAQYLCF